MVCGKFRFGRSVFEKDVRFLNTLQDIEKELLPGIILA